MSGETIDFGVDLGTTNSLIAKCHNGVVEVFRDPGQGRETLPSVVGFRKERILVGQNAKTYLLKEPKNVFSRFKRKMGTTESFHIKSLNQTKGPVELSAFVLKELRTFVHTGEQPVAGVITVPASFDTVQSTDTKEAGIQAGFKQVVLLQEPIAASLAYANKAKDCDLKNSQWLVYDLGGGTFDVALVKIVDNELKVLDHEGDNFLGGSDFDAEIVERLIAPALKKQGQFGDLEAELKNESGRYNSLWFKLLHLAEEAKVLLSTKTSADIDFEEADDSGEEHEFHVTITRSEFESIIKSRIDRTAEMVKSILTRNSLLPSDVKFVLMVGGCTFIPYVRKRIEELLQIPLNCDIDPITAIVVGAAYFASTREKVVPASSTGGVSHSALRIKAVYNRASHEDEELFFAKIEGAAKGLQYRIKREDGGYDSGLKELVSRITEDLPLERNAYNSFVMTIVRQDGSTVAHDLGAMQIAHGKYSVAGQSASLDICLVVDDLSQERTKSVCLFKKNQILPATKKITVSANTTVLTGAADQSITIKVVEGAEEASPEANLPMGAILITGKLCERDIVKGSDIDLTFEMSESRELSVSVYVTAINQVFEATFSQTRRDVTIDVLAAEVELLHDKLADEIEEAEKSENYEVARELNKLEKGIIALQNQVTVLSADDVTDDRQKLDNTKRELAKTLDSLTKDKKLDRARSEYNEAKRNCDIVITESGNDRERHMLQEIIQQEPAFVSSRNPSKIQQQTSVLISLKYAVLRRLPSFLGEMFNSLVDQQQRMNDQTQAKCLIESGRLAISSQNVDRLDDIIGGLINLLPEGEKTTAQKSYMGISYH